MTDCSETPMKGDREHRETASGDSQPLVMLCVDATIAELADAANRLTASLPAWRQWQRDHEPELDRLRQLNATITERRLEVAMEPSVTVDVADHGISL